MADQITVGLTAAPEIDGADYESWLHELFPAYIKSLADHHREYWKWVYAIQPGIRPKPFLAIWARGGGKSVSAELTTIAVGARGVRRYILYCCETQDQADKHVASIGAALVRPQVERYYPGLANRSVGKYGHSNGWRRDRLTTTSGLTIDAIGLDTAVRGAREMEDRPDMIILDDIDNKTDSMKTVKKKIETLTTSVLPAGSADCAVLFVQNLIHSYSIAYKLIHDDADFLRDRVVSGENTGSGWKSAGLG